MDRAKYQVTAEPNWGDADTKEDSPTRNKRKDYRNKNARPPGRSGGGSVRESKPRHSKRA